MLFRSQLPTLRPLISSTSNARRASPKKLSLVLSMREELPVRSSRSSARGASSRMSAQPGGERQDRERLCGCVHVCVPVWMCVHVCMYVCVCVCVCA